MLDDVEWAILAEAHNLSAKDPAAALAVIERERARRGLPALPELPADAAYIQRLLRHLTAGYETFTGVAEPNPNAVWHHSISEYGAPCVACGKPLRTPQAKLCVACGRAKA